MRAATAGLLAFVLCMLVSAWVYPGGNVVDGRAPGYSFWFNYWCDLVSTRAINGGDHQLGAWVARAGFAAFAVTLWRFWPMAAALARRTQSGTAARVLGCFGAVALLGVAAVPPTTSELWHALLVSLSAGSSIGAALVLIPAQWPRVDATTRALGALVTVSATITLLQYLRQGLLQRDFADWLPGAQKLTTLFMLLWMGRLFWRHRDAATPQLTPSSRSDTVRKPVGNG